MAIISRLLRCGCTRTPTLCQSPTAIRCGFRDPTFMIRRFLASHAETVPFSEQTIATVRAYFARYFDGVRPYHFNDRLADLAKPTSPGIYYRRLGYKTKAQVVNDPKAAQRLRTYCHLIKTGQLRNPRPLSMVVVTDAKERETDIKARVAWVYPIEITAIENMFFASLRDRLPPDWVPSPDTHHRLFCGSKSMRNRSVDFTSFDSSLPRPIIEIAFNILLSYFDFSSYQGGARPYSKSSLHRLWQLVVDYFIHTPFRTAVHDHIMTKHHGVPSGSMFTNIIDTICSRLILTHCHAHKWCPVRICTYGDDCHYSNCCCYDEDIEDEAEDLGLLIKIERPNEHGCLTYCKAECHLGEPYHEGIWFVNILNCCPKRYVREVAWCLLQSACPTSDQAQFLSGIAKEPGKLGSSITTWIEKFIEFSPKFSRLISTL